MRRLGESIKEMLDVNFGPAGDDNLKPWSLCSGTGQDPQEIWATSSVATLVQCVNDEDESVLRVARKWAGELKDECALHRLLSKSCGVGKVLCYNGLERR